MEYSTIIFIAIQNLLYSFLFIFTVKFINKFEREKKIKESYFIRTYNLRQKIEKNQVISFLIFWLISLIGFFIIYYFF